MKLERCRDQPSKTLDEFYGERVAESHPVSQSIGHAMLAIIVISRWVADDEDFEHVEAHSLDEAVTAIVRAMDLSGGWRKDLPGEAY